ncbi:MAG TPA: hypothetical protein VLN48_16990, partial [Bryobacteraceae bacterium]|nr:hypothetical protein [Bryobacteraceae bacterium]
MSAPRAEAVAAPPAAPPAPSVSQWSSFVSFGAALSAGVGLVCLAGRVFDISILKSGWPGLVPIKANTSICLILLGVSLWLRKAETQQTRGRILVAQLLAGVVAAIGVASFMEYLFGWDLGIDQLLFVEEADAIGLIRPGLMSPVN